MRRLTPNPLRPPSACSSQANGEVMSVKEKTAKMFPAPGGLPPLTLSLSSNFDLMIQKDQHPARHTALFLPHSPRQARLLIIRLADSIPIAPS